MDNFAIGKQKDKTDEVLKQQAAKNRQSEDAGVRRMQDICDIFGPKLPNGEGAFVILPKKGNIKKIEGAKPGGDFEPGSIVETRDITPNPRLLKILRKGR